MSIELKVKPIYLDSDGILSQTPNGAIANFGGTTNPTFTVGGRGLLFDDGTSTAPGNQFSVTLQSAYDNSGVVDGKVTINLEAGKDLVINAGSVDKFLSIDADTGNFTFSGLLSVLGNTNISGNLILGGTLNGINIEQLKSDLDNHLGGDPEFRHLAADIDVFPINNLTGVSNVQEALEHINTKVEQTSANGVKGYEHVQVNSAGMWTITHNLNTRRIQTTIYDQNWEQIIPENVKIENANTVIVSFGNSITGRAMIFAF
jgi:hypothetical protein